VPLVGAVLSSVRLSVVAVALLPAASVPLTGMLGAPLAPLPQVIEEER